MEEILTAKYYEAIKEINNDFNGSVSGNTHEDIVINWNGITEISVDDIKAKISEMDTAKENQATELANLKASAKAKLVAGEALTEDEANVMIGG
jgi:hypothetical protein